MATPYIPPVTRLFAKIERRGANECWLWKGGVVPKGYGCFLLDGRQTYAHRAVYSLLVAPIPAGMLVCHTCDNPGCCNPAHLWVGSCQDNIRDMHAKGRNYNGKDKITHCPRGHIYDVENTRYYKGHRSCRQCDRDRNGRLKRISSRKELRLSKTVGHAGEHNGRAILTSRQVVEARFVHRIQNMPIAEIAKKLGVHYSTVHRAINGKGWKHLNEQTP